MRGGMEARAFCQMWPQGGEVDRDRDVRNRKGHGILPRVLIDDQSDVAEGRIGQTQPRQSANPLPKLRVAMR
jgi:hypothetical protein